ncbi:MAG: NCS2 family permease, partial [Mycoplasmatales bacterium]
KEIIMDRFFEISKRGSTFKKEIIAGMTTFLSMSYILVVNPLILSETGMNEGAVFTATIISSIIACLIMGLYANFPMALAPGMGMNAFFTYTVVLTLGYTWQEALFGIFISGIIFLILSISGIREQIINMIPQTLKYAVSAGIGLFIAFIGLTGSGIIVANEATLVTLGDLTSPITALSCIGILLTFILISRKINGAIFISMGTILVATIVLQISGVDLGIVFPYSIISMPPSLDPVFGQLFVGTNPVGLLTDFSFWIVIISFLFVDFFDTTGTLIGVGLEANLVSEDGQLQDAKKALLCDATATTLGAVVGTSSVTTFAESLTGVSVGGRTGLVAIVVAICFAIASFFSPILTVVTTAVTTPALVAVGAMMAVNKGKIDYSNFKNTASAFMTMIFMITSYSIAEGISAGFITYTVCSVAQGDYKKVHPIMYVLTVLFILHYFI